MNIKLTLILLVVFGRISFAQTSSQPDLEKKACFKASQAIIYLKTYVKRQSLPASIKAVKLLDTTQLLMKNLNRDSLAISPEDFNTIENSVTTFKKQDYKKILANEKKAPKVRVRLEGESFLMSKNNFMALYSLFRILEELFNRWNEKL